MNYGMRFMTFYRRQESRPSPIKRNAKKAKWLLEEALQIAMKRREVKSKGEKERNTHLNAEFQRIARRDKKAFLSDQCKEIEETDRMGKTRDLFKKIRDTKGTFHGKMPGGPTAGHLAGGAGDGVPPADALGPQDPDAGKY